MNAKERFISVINGEQPDQTPVFPLLMHFAANRSGYSYREYAQSGEILAESQVNAFKRYNIDAISSCSDAFRITADLGADMVFPEQTPPHSNGALIKTPADLAKVTEIDFGKGRTGDRIKSVRQMVDAVGDQCAVLGWVDMPFAECCSLCGVAEFMMILYDEPAFAHQLLEKVTQLVIQFALLQVGQGAIMVGAGDAAASLVSPDLFREFAMPYEAAVCKAIHDYGNMMKLHICGNTSRLLDEMLKCDADMYNIDHMVDFETAARVYGDAGKAFKGNLDPVEDILNGTPDHVIAEVKKRKEIAGDRKYMVSAGCEIPAKTPDEIFIAFCDALR